MPQPGPAAPSAATRQGRVDTIKPNPERNREPDRHARPRLGVLIGGSAHALPEGPQRRRPGPDTGRKASKIRYFRSCAAATWSTYDIAVDADQGGISSPVGDSHRLDEVIRGRQLIN